MKEAKFNLLFRIKHLFTHHPWLKVIALLLAVIVWFYVKGEMLRLR